MGDGIGWDKTELTPVICGEIAASRLVSLNLKVGLGTIDDRLDDSAAVRVAIRHSGEVHVGERCGR